MWPSHHFWALLVALIIASPVSCALGAEPRLFAKGAVLLDTPDVTVYNDMRLLYRRVMLRFEWHARGPSFMQMSTTTEYLSEGQVFLVPVPGKYTIQVEVVYIDGSIDAIVTSGR